MIQPGTSTGSIAVTAGTQSVTGPGVLLYANLLGGSTNNDLTIYDGTSTGGTLLISIGNVTAGVSQSQNLPQGVVFNQGLFVVVSGTSSTAVVHYRRN